MHTIKNKFFGGNVGVAGLVTATDIIAQCEGKLTSGTLGVPAVMLREEKDTFLDDITTDQLAQRLGVKVEVLPTSGGDEARALLRSGADDAQLLAAIWETIWAKPREHHFNDSSMPATRGMYRIGG